MSDDAAADEEHRGGAGDGQGLHEKGGEPEDGVADALLEISSAEGEVEARVVELHDARDQAIHPDGHDDGDGAEDHQLALEILPCHSAERDGDDLGGEHEISPNRTLYFLRFGLGGDFCGELFTGF